MNEPIDSVRDRELDHRIDGDLRAAFTPPPVEAVAAIANEVSSAPIVRLPWTWLIAAAALLLTIGFVWVGRGATPTGPEGHDGKQLGHMFAAAYQHALANDPGSDGRKFCCDPSLDFCGTCEKRFAVRIAVDAGGREVMLRGCYCGLPVGGSVAALFDTAHGPVGVFVVPRGNDPRPSLPADSALHLARRELGDLVLYAVSRAQQPPPSQPLEQFVLAP